MIARRLMDGDDGLAWEFGDDVLDAAFTEPGEANEVDVAAAEETEGGMERSSLRSNMRL